MTKTGNNKIAEVTNYLNFMRLIAAKALISNAFVASESLLLYIFHQQLLFCVTIATI